MEYTIHLFVGAGIAAFIALIAFMIGYVWKERQHEQYNANARDAFESERKAWRGHRDLAGQQLEKLKMWRNAVITPLLLNHLWDPAVHANDEDAAVHTLLCWEGANALNPEISVAARKLINKAKREHGKKLRGQFERKLKREIDKVLSDTQRVRVESDMWKHSSQSNAENLANARFEMSMYQGAVSQALDNFIRLPSVRNACQRDINEQHKAIQADITGV